MMLGRNAHRLWGVGGQGASHSGKFAIDHAIKQCRAVLHPQRPLALSLGPRSPHMHTRMHTSLALVRAALSFRRHFAKPWVTTCSPSMVGAGWRVGWALSTPEVLKGLAVYHHNTSYCAPSPLQYGLSVALEAEDGSFEVRMCCFTRVYLERAPQAVLTPRKWLEQRCNEDLCFPPPTLTFFDTHDILVMFNTAVWTKMSDM